MKNVKRIGLLVLYPLIMTLFGFGAGIWSARYLYTASEETIRDVYQTEDIAAKGPTMETEQEKETIEVLNASETLSVDTQYVLEETDMVDQSSVETVWRLPAKYVGMNREQFLEAMQLYEAFPPLTEQERGFVSLEVLSFSKERVVVQMNYRYVQPGEGFYLAVKDNEVVVYLEDARTIYIETGIQMDTLPETLQLDIMNMLWMEDEESLYDFLEAYSS